MNAEEYKALKAMAPQEGLVIGILWVAAFACYIGQLMQPILGLMVMPLSLISVIVAVNHLRGYRNQHLDFLPYFKAFVYLFQVFLYASLIMALGQWIYFQFMDQGFLYSEIMKMMGSQEFKQAMEVYKDMDGFDENIFKVAVDQISQMRPIDIAFQFLSVDVVVSLFLSLFLAMLSMGKAVKKA